MKNSHFQLDLKEVTRIYNRGSVIESRLIEWLKKAYEAWGSDLSSISGSVDSTGEGEWTINTAREMGIEVPVISESFEFRKRSKINPSYVGKVVSALRGQFGGHSVKK
jgi:6-phosphogluconate dehydrogenase